MSFAHRCFFIACLSLFLFGFAPALRATQPGAIDQIATQPDPGARQGAYTLPPDKLAKAQALDRIRNTLDIVSGLWSVAVLWLLLATHAAASLERWAQRCFKRKWQQGLLFFAAFLVIITVASVPIDLYGHYASRAFGISVQSWVSWAGDQAKALGLTVLIGAPILLLFNWLVRRWPRHYWFAAWLATLPLMVISVFVAPLFEPIFNQYEPLARNHGALVEKLERVVIRTHTNIPPDRMFLMKASEKTNGLNAYVNGIGATKRIVVWDTTAGRIPDDEVMFIFGHESGHYVLNHIPKELSGMAIALLFVYWACAAFAAWLVGYYRAKWRLESGDSAANPLSSRAGFVVLIFAITVAGFVLEPIGNTFSRHFEHEADIYGQEAIHGLVPDPQKTAVAAFQALGEAWLEDPNPNPFIEFWLYNHPSVKNRANFAAHYNPWANGGHGRFFDR